MTLKQRVRGKSKKEKNDQKSEDSMDRIEEQRNKKKILSQFKGTI